MGAITLYHPVDVRLIRHSLDNASISTGKFQQVKADPLGNHATYDVYIKDLAAIPFIPDLLTPRHVLDEVNKALGKHEVGWGWSGRCVSVVWRNGHWIARINVALLEAAK